MSFKVAVLEDDPALLDDILVPGLRSLGFDAEGFGAAKDLYRRMLAQSFDAIVLDIGLPDENGFEVARYLRAHSRLAILALSGMRFSQEDKEKVGADAWLTKPIDVHEIGRLLSDLRRRKGANGSAKADSNWHVDPSTWRLYTPDGRYVALGLSERLIMEQLLSSPGEVISREHLIVALTDSTYDFDPHRLEMLIHRLRRKVHKALGIDLPLRTVRGIGYTMLASVDQRAYS